jgi:nicotinamide-nucleotide amidase
MTAEIVSVGTELLLGQIVDTHAPTMARILADCGIACTHRQTVGDNLPRAVAALNDALRRADVVITIGGLGPTQDDLTREAIAEALGDTLESVPEELEKLRKLFALRKFHWVETNARQAMKPTSGRMIDNPNGTAPGLICEKDGKVVIALPGPRNEFDPMAGGAVREFLCRLEGGQVIHSRILRICGMGESLVEEKIRPLMEGLNPTVAPYAHPGEVHLRITARAASREIADRMIEPVEQKIRAILGDHVYGADTTSLEEAIIDILRERDQNVSVAESITGGLLGSRLTSVAGSGDAFLGGVISYAVSVKEAVLGVPHEVLERFGPVSPECAEEMALAAKRITGSDYAVSLTGNAGPTSDADGKPVGLVYIAVASPRGVTVEEVGLGGSRDDIRTRAAFTALTNLRSELLSVGV